jgi:hypothetical protein
MRITTLFVMLTLIFIAISAEAATNLLNNGNFETGDLTGWTWTPTPLSDISLSPTVVTFDAVVGQPSLCFRVNPGNRTEATEAKKKEAVYRRPLTLLLEPSTLCP